MPKKLTKEQLTKDYDHIDVIKGLAAVRKRPGMYISSTRTLDGEKNPRGLIQLAQEILSNAIDEAYAGFGKKIQMIIHKDNSLTVIDEGRGVPTGGKDLSSVIAAFTVLHASGKFNSKNYANSLGTNGVGASCATALSKFLSVEAVTTRNEHYFVKFQQEKILEKKNLAFKKTMHTGTKVTFLPDTEIFDTIDWDDEVLINKLEQSAFLTPKVKFIFIDERRKPLKDDTEHDYYYREWYSENGMPDYVSYISQSEELVKGLKKPISFNGDYTTSKNDVMHVEGALIYTENSGETILSFANGGPTVQGGTHVDGAKLAIFQAFKDYAKTKKLLKRKQSIESQDTRDGLILTLLIKVPENLLMFDSQSKTNLATPEAKKAANEVIYDQVTAWLYDHPTIAKRIITNMVDARNARQAAIKAKRAAREARKTKSGTGKLVVSSKLKPASGKDPKKKSLFITEGDSASALLTLVRDKKYQAVFPLRGKILNTCDEKLSRVVQNVEISTIASVLGAGIGPVFKVDELDYDKIIILTDSDDDGFHISSLLITLFYKFFPGLIENGHLYKVTAPLYRTELKNKHNNHTKVELAYSESEHEDFEKRVQEDIKSGYKLIKAERWKGLGSMGKKNTLDYIANPATRKITQITIDDAQTAKQMLNLWMGKNADIRKQQISETVDFDNIVLD